MVYGSLLAVALTLLLLATYVLRAKPTATINRTFAAYTCAVAGWVAGVAGLYSGRHEPQWAGVSFASASFIPAAFVAFSYAYPSDSRWPPRWVIRGIFVIAGIFAAVALTTTLIVYDVAFTSDAPVRKAGPLYFAFTLYFAASWVLAVLMLATKWKRVRGIARTQLQYLGVALFIPGMFAITANLIIPFFTGSSVYSALGPYSMLLFLVLVAHAIIRLRALDLRLVVHRGLVLTIAGALSTIPAITLIFVLRRLLSGHVSPSELIVLFASTFLVALLAPPTRDLARYVIDRYVYRAQANYRATVLKASRRLTQMLDSRIIGPFVVQSIGGATNAEAAALYLVDEAALFTITASQRHRISSFGTPRVVPDVVIDGLKRSKDALVADEIARTAGAEALALTAALSQLNWGLVLPVISEDEVIGAIVLGPKLSGDPFYPQDLDLLMTLANQAGIAIKNAQLYDAVVLANEYIENIVATIESGVVAIATNGHIAMFNRAAERLTGLAAQSLKGRPVGDLPACLAEMLLTSVADGQARTQPEVALPGRVGSKPVICTTSPLRDPHGAILGAVAVFSDLTPLKELEIERRRAEKLAYFEVLASGIAHEIKNPLVAMKTFAQLLPRRHGDERFIDDFARVVTREIARLERLVERLRALSRPGERPSRIVDLRLPLGDAVEAVQAAFAEKSLALEARLGDEPRVVLAHHDELVQIFLNLLINAHDATPPGGRVVVTLTANEDGASVSVADTGSGIPPELLERVFDPFITTKQQGTGLGLAICAGIAQRHGARLTAANRPEGGAIFRIDFPLAAISTAVAR